MKTRPTTEAAPRRPGTRLPFSVFLPVLFSLSALAAPAPDAPPKDHALFVGTSLQIKDGETFHELVAADSNTVTVLADGKARTLPRNGVGAVRIEPGLKLSSLVAQIDDLRTTPVNASPSGDRFASDRMYILMNSMVDRSAERMDGAIQSMETASRMVDTATGFSKAASEQHLRDTIESLNKEMSSNTAWTSSVSSLLPVDGTANAVDVSCSVAAPRATRDAYVLLVTEYRINSRDQPQYKVHVQPLRDLGPKPQRLTMTQAGLPVGFILGRVDVHVYADGQELATNLSEQRVDLTADDALRYLVICYVAAHPKDTLVATPLKMGVPADFKAQVSAEQLERPLYVKVGVDGTVQGVSAAADRSAAADPYVDAAVRKFRYNPALAAGKPVESVVPLRLADYVR